MDQQNMILVELLIGWEGPKNLESGKKQHTILLSYYVRNTA